MCGIVGFISKQKDTQTIKEMLKIQSYRGPDDSGLFFDESGVHLGHNRLSIQDLSPLGHQPFISDCGEYIISFNGEVYNFKPLREELKALGYNFISQSDTEVILYSYKEWGIKCIEKFIGMFAFALLDKKEDKLTLVRDRAGVKPLYYYHKENNFIFSSEIKSFHQHPNFQKEINYEIIPYYFQFGYIPTPYSIFKNCFKLEAGTYLEYDLKNSDYKIVKYWDVNDFYKKEKLDLSESEIITSLENILEDAISIRMISDVKVGLFLSGGYDSSLVASLLTKKHSKKIDTFTIGFEDKKFNEAQHASSIANYLETNHHEYYVKDSDIFELIEQTSFYWDEPFGDSSSLPTMIVSKMAKEKVGVVLSADGGDEAFFGYSKYIFLNKFSNIFSSSFKLSLLKSSINLIDDKLIENINNYIPKKFRQTNIKDKFSKLQRAINSNNLYNMFMNASSYTDNKIVKKMLNLEINNSIFNNFKNQNIPSFMSHMMAVDYKTFMNDDVLTKVDRATMSVSLEGREPLIDHRIIEFMAQVPDSIKYKNNQAKYLAREILYKYIPKEIIDKPKAGFQIPLNQFLRGELRHIVDKYIHKDRLDSKIFNIEEILKIKNDFLNGADNATQIWFIISFQMWKERWFD
ncbi:MAG: asparagine synthase [Sulfurovum sp. AS07-7]|nr:MAG: asparagine synthase [Sulfurovum sp. AS07-7]